MSNPSSRAENSVVGRESFGLILTIYIVSALFLFHVFLQLVLAVSNRFGTTDFDVFSAESALVMALLGSILAALSVTRSYRAINRQFKANNQNGSTL